MATTALQTLKSWFVRGAKPTAAQFASAFDSFWHKLESIPISAIESLQSELNAKASTTDVNTALAGKASTTHTHTMAEITGVASAISSIEDDVNDIEEQMADIVHSYTIDFQTASITVQYRNLHGSIKLTKIVTDNVSTLRLSINGTVQILTLINGVWAGTLALANEDLLIWNIGRSTEGTIAEINIKYEYNN